jgi:3-isopropylmalate/(R)-2-methylmalate dehydratase small subunit
LNGKAFKFGDDVDTDVIIPARYLVTTDVQELAVHCMEDGRRGFANEVTPGDIIVAGKNFGCGSSREHAPLSIKGNQISCVIAKSFARIFFRNCFNCGLPVFECPEASEKIEEGDQVEVDQATGMIKNITKNETYQAQPIPEFMQQLVAAGGLMEYVKKNM